MLNFLGEVMIEKETIDEIGSETTAPSAVPRRYYQNHLGESILLNSGDEQR